MQIAIHGGPVWPQAALHASTLRQHPGFTGEEIKMHTQGHELRGGQSYSQVQINLTSKAPDITNDAPILLLAVSMTALPECPMVGMVWGV